MGCNFLEPVFAFNVGKFNSGPCGGVSSSTGLRLSLGIAIPFALGFLAAALDAAFAGSLKIDTRGIIQQLENRYQSYNTTA